MSRRRAPETAARPVQAYIGLGSNLADPRAQIARAVAAIDRLPHTSLAAQSSLYRTAPHGVSARQPDYLNAVVKIETSLHPASLLRALQDIERAQRRRRSAPNAPRSIDLDLLLYGTHRRASRELSLPHPRLHRRAFVLKPLVELSPAIVIPGLGCARKFLHRARTQRVVRLPDARPATR